jgi:hypothetical protein
MIWNGALKNSGPWAAAMPALPSGPALDPSHNSTHRSSWGYFFLPFSLSQLPIYCRSDYYSIFYSWSLMYVLYQYIFRSLEFDLHHYLQVLWSKNDFFSIIHKRVVHICIKKKIVWYPDGHPAASLTRFSTKAYSRGTKLTRCFAPACRPKLRLIHLASICHWKVGLSLVCQKKRAKGSLGSEEI